jgi:apolipoprotein N-acyltransferase
VAGLKVAPLICYEAVFGSEVRTIFEEGAPDLLVNVTNDMWFGRTQGPYLHRMIVALRAVETRRPLVRVATTGLTVMILPDGSFQDATELGTQAVGASDLPLMGGEVGPTPYVRWGDWFGWGALIVLVGVLVAYREIGTISGR